MGIGGIGRRGLLASAAAVIAGGLAKLSASDRAEAAHTGSDETIIHANAINTTTDITRIEWFPAPADNAPTTSFRNSSTVYRSFKDGVQGSAGVNGLHAGLRGHHDGSGIGVVGQAGSSSGCGVYGNVGGDASTPPPPGTGVFGRSLDGSGVVGNSNTGPAIQGASNIGDGILGFSSGNLKYSLAGSGSGQAHGLIGYSANQFGISGINQSGNNWAGTFFNAQATAPGAGRKGLFVQGDFVVLNGTKSAGVKTNRHGHRKLYAVEATENVFEDFGTAQLRAGRAQVELEDVFADTVNTGARYFVFLTPRGDCQGLYITAQDAKGFSVQELQGGSSNIEFDYRVVAKVKGQEGKRLEQFEPPAMPPPPPVPERAAPQPVPPPREDRGR